MRILFGMILGCLLTIAAVYVHDSMAPLKGTSIAAASTSRAIVDWDVATSEWARIKESARTTWLKLRTGTNG